MRIRGSGKITCQQGANELGNADDRKNTCAYRATVLIQIYGDELCPGMLIHPVRFKSQRLYHPIGFQGRSEEAFTFGNRDRFDSQISSPYLNFKTVFILACSSAVRPFKTSQPRPESLNHVSAVLWE